jgi:hypothetical protein
VKVKVSEDWETEEDWRQLSQLGLEAAKPLVRAPVNRLSGPGMVREA